VIRDLAQHRPQADLHAQLRLHGADAEGGEGLPDVKFESITGYKTAPNVATANARYYEGRYLAGIAAGRMTKTQRGRLRRGLPDPRSAAGHQRLHARHAVGRTRRRR
jgi:basic membrane protein A